MGEIEFGDVLSRDALYVCLIGDDDRCFSRQSNGIYVRASCSGKKDVVTASAAAYVGMPGNTPVVSRTSTDMTKVVHCILPGWKTPRDYV